MLFTIISFIIVLSILVFVHEAGHFFVARWFGVKAEEFGFGFPPRAWGVYRSVGGKWKNAKGNSEVHDAADTIYSINWIPLGGFVKIKGENGEMENEPDSFGYKPIWQRTMILSAGVLMNMVLAIVLLSFGYLIGLPRSIDETLSARATVKDVRIQIVDVIGESPAQKAGIMAGDTIVSIDGRIFEKEEDVTAYVRDRENLSLHYVLEQSGKKIESEITPVRLESTGNVGIGVGIARTGIVSYPWYLAFLEGFSSTMALAWAILLAFYNLIAGLFRGDSVGADLAGPVRIAQLTGEVAQMGLAYVIQFTAVLSINLAIINFLPIPALDGGRVFFLAIEKLKGSPIKREVEAMLHNIFFIILIILILLVTMHDVTQLNVFKRIFG